MIEFLAVTWFWLGITGLALWAIAFHCGRYIAEHEAERQTAEFAIRLAEAESAPFSSMTMCMVIAAVGGCILLLLAVVGFTATRFLGT